MSQPETRRVVVKLFAGAKQAAGADQVELELPDDATVGQVRRLLIERVPALSSLGSRALLAIDCEFAADSQRVPRDAEVALIPPVSGG